MSYEYGMMPCVMHQQSINSKLVVLSNARQIHIDSHNIQHTCYCAYMHFVILLHVTQLVSTKLIIIIYKQYVVLSLLLLSINSTLLIVYIRCPRSRVRFNGHLEKLPPLFRNCCFIEDRKQLVVFIAYSTTKATWTATPRRQNQSSPTSWSQIR